MDNDQGGKLNLVTAFIHGYAATIHMPLRNFWGRGYPGVYLVIGLVWMMVWILHNHHDRLIIYAGILILGQVAHVLSGKWRGVHSRYEGYPVFAMRLGFSNEETAKAIGEPFLAVIAGFGLIACGFPEGSYFVWGAAAMVLSCFIDRTTERERVEEIRDSILEGQYLMQQARRRW